MIDPIVKRPFERQDLWRISPQASQVDWVLDTSDALADGLARCGTVSTWIRGDDILAFGGVVPMPRGPMLFCVLSNAAKGCRAALYRSALKAVSEARGSFTGMWTHTEDGDDTQRGWVKRLGFKQVGCEVSCGRRMNLWELPS